MPNPSSISVEERQVAGTHLGGTSGAQPDMDLADPRRGSRDRQDLA